MRSWYFTNFKCKVLGFYFARFEGCLIILRLYFFPKLFTELDYKYPYPLKIIYLITKRNPSIYILCTQVLRRSSLICNGCIQEFTIANYPNLEGIERFDENTIMDKN